MRESMGENRPMQLNDTLAVLPYVAPPGGDAPDDIPPAVPDGGFDLAALGTPSEYSLPPDILAAAAAARPPSPFGSPEQSLVVPPPIPSPPVPTSEQAAAVATEILDAMAMQGPPRFDQEPPAALPSDYRAMGEMESGVTSLDAAAMTDPGDPDFMPGPDFDAVQEPIVTRRGQKRERSAVSLAMPTERGGPPEEEAMSLTSRPFGPPPVRRARRNPAVPPPPPPAPAGQVLVRADPHDYSQEFTLLAVGFGIVVLIYMTGPSR